jgi:hypothetical protein
MAAEPLDRSKLLYDVLSDRLRWIAACSGRNKDGEKFNFRKCFRAELGQLPASMLPVLILVHRTANLSQICASIKQT